MPCLSSDTSSVHCWLTNAGHRSKPGMHVQCCALQLSWWPQRRMLVVHALEACPSSVVSLPHHGHLCPLQLKLHLHYSTEHATHTAQSSSETMQGIANSPGSLVTMPNSLPYKPACSPWQLCLRNHYGTSRGNLQGCAPRDRNSIHVLKATTYCQAMSWPECAMLTWQTVHQITIWSAFPFQRIALQHEHDCLHQHVVNHP